MSTLFLRLSGRRETVDQLVDILGRIEGIERAEVIDDLMPHLDDEDSSSAGLAENSHDEVVQVELEADDEAIIERARAVAEEGATRAGLALEIVDGF